MPVAVPGATRASRQRDDPREGAHARAHALRGFGVLRQADARAARGVERGRCRSSCARSGWCRTRSRSSTSACCWSRSRRGRSRCWSSPRLPAFVAETQVLRRRVPAVSLAHARDAHADVPRDGARARGPREGGQALRARPAASSVATSAIFDGLYDDDRELTMRRETWGFALGLLVDRGVLRHVRLDRASPRSRRDHARRDDDVRDGVQAGPVGGQPRALGAIGGMYEDNLYLSTLYEFLETPVDAQHRHGSQRAGSRATACASSTSRSRIPGASDRALTTSTCTSRRARSSRSSARTAPARPR